MPNVYISAKFKTTVTLSDDDDFVFGEWTDKKLAKERKEYEKPNKGIWLQIVNPDDENDIYPIPITENDLYDGILDVTQEGRNFSFSFDGKAKVTIHKTTKEKLESGLTPKVSGLMLNGQQFEVDFPIDAVIQSKKI